MISIFVIKNKYLNIWIKVHTKFFTRQRLFFYSCFTCIWCLAGVDFGPWWPIWWMTVEREKNSETKKDTDVNTYVYTAQARCWSSYGYCRPRCALDCHARRSPRWQPYKLKRKERELRTTFRSALCYWCQFILSYTQVIFYLYINCHTWYSLGDWGRMVRPSLHMGPWSPFSTQSSVSSWSSSRSSTRRLSWPSPCSW